MTSNELEIFKQSILDEVRVMMQTTGQVTQYIGARYVPLFADPLEWSDTKEYEPLTIVLHQGNSFTSRQFVPRGIDISNTEFWANTGNYNAQIEQYRQEIATFDGRITANAHAIADETARAKKADQELSINLSNSAFIIGNSYTAGFDEVSKTHSVSSVADKIFDKAYIRGASAAGFIAYTDHSIVFEDLLNTLINENPDKLDTITHVIFNSAIGDSRAYLELGAAKWRAQMKTTLNSIVNTIHNKLPRCKYIGICYMESIDRNYRVYNDIYETFTDFVNVGRQLFGMCSTNKYLTFMGFAGSPVKCNVAC